MIQVHHRRVKGMGGDTRAHANCACVLVCLCLQCHEIVHGPGRALAGEQGYIMSRSEQFPRLVPVIRLAARGGTRAAWPACDGTWITEAPAISLAQDHREPGDDRD